MPINILEVGNCAMDHATIDRFLTRHFDCQVDQAHQATDALTLLREGDYALVLVNRKLDRDHSNGIEVIKQIKADPECADVPVMLITNYAEHQEAAIAAGALRGFGKLELENEETLERLKAGLG